MSHNLTPIFVDDGTAELLGISETGWHLIDDNHRAVAGPFTSKTEAERYAKKVDA